MSQFNFIYAEEHLSHREKTVYIYLHDRADAAGICWPGVKRIASDLKLSRRTVQRTLNDLEQAGLVLRQFRRRPNGSLTSNLYQLTASEGMKKRTAPARGAVRANSEDKG